MTAVAAKAAPTPMGHNSGGRFQPRELKSYVDRLVAIDEEKQTFVDDFKDVTKEAVSHGFNRRALLQVVRRKRQGLSDKRKQEEEILESYLFALDMLK
jgi:uncharacterized protein (UPF0335 family)